MSKIRKTITAAFCFVSATLAFVSAGDAPDAAQTVDMILSGPQKPFKGHLMISMWTDKGAKAEDVNIFFQPPDKYRMEFLRPDGSVDRVVLSNSVKEETQLLKNDQVVQNYFTTFPQKSLQSRDQKSLLLENYKVSVKPGEKLLGRSTWLVDWAPVIPGKPHHQMRVDQQTHVVLETKQYSTDDSQSGSLTRFTDFVPNTSASNNLFLTEVETNAALDTTHTISPADAQRAKDAQLFSKKLAGGFSFESISYLDITGKTVKHVRYTDGVLPLSLFQTPVPVKIPSNTTGNALSAHGSPLQATGSGNVYHWEKGKNYFTLMGDVPEPLLQDISRDFR